MLDVEPVILEELQRLVPPGDIPRPAWDDVLRRIEPIGHRRRRMWPAYAIAAVVIVWLAAPAFGVRPPFLDFFSSSAHVPKRVVRSFKVLNVVAPRGMSPNVVAAQTRRVTVYHLRDGKRFPLFVAPRRTGGFCYTFGYAGGCTDRSANPHDQTGDLNVRDIGLGRLGSHIYAGSVFDQRIDHLQLRFVDGTHADIPLLWVSPPIDAGFFLYDLTYSERRSAHAPKEMVALDAQGHVLARNRSMFAPPSRWSNPANVSDPSRKRVILRSGEMTIAVSPSSAGGNCWWLQANGLNVGGGCAPPRYLTIPMAGGLNHGTHFTSFSAQLRPAVARVELRFQDGARIELHPVEGFVLYDIPPTHWPRGSRLIEAVAFDAGGSLLRRQTFDPREFGTYPCTKQVSVGAGETACP